jgi:crotonobetainyl-CoA:carnitine CoA-transferase CaiB-like acyl-CoA transferase
VIGVLAALLHRNATGEGQLIDVAMYDSMVALDDAGLNYWSMGVANAGTLPLINHAFAASDGWFSLQVLRPQHCARLADLLGEPAWRDDPDMATPTQWYEHLEDRVRPAVERWASTRTKAEAAGELGRAGLASGPVHTQADVAADPHLARRNMLVEMPRTDGVEQPILSPGNPVKLSKMAEGPWTRVPWVGEHTAEVLGVELGLSPDDLDDLAARGVIARSGG